MKLRDWLKANDLTPEAFAIDLGEKPKRIVRYCADPASPEYRIPRREIMARITERTAGAVTANDFYAFTEPPPERKAEAA